MAGRGTDIKLAPEVKKGKICLVNSLPGKGDCASSPGVAECRDQMPCGLHIIGTERHESRRIDRQLRGRSGRQGDPGSSRFFLSLEDDLMRLFGSDRIAGMMHRMGVQEGEVITHSLVTKAIERAQKRVEAHNFDIRKHLLDYDNVMNQQRDVIYSLRNDALDQGDLSARIRELVENKITALVDEHLDPKAGREHWDAAGLESAVQSLILAPIGVADAVAQGKSRDEIMELCRQAGEAAYARREEIFGVEQMREIERQVQITVIDDKWRDHLYEIDQLRGGIGLRAYGQKDPLLEYKAEAYRMFQELVESIDDELLRYLFRIVPRAQAMAPRPAARPASAPAVAASSGGFSRPTAVGVGRVAGTMTEQHASSSALSGGPAPAAPAGAGGVATMDGSQGPAASPQSRTGPAGPTPGRGPGGPPRPAMRSEPKVGRNEPCPCGSGKKYKKCCGAEA